MASYVTNQIAAFVTKRKNICTYKALSYLSIIQLLSWMQLKGHPVTLVFSKYPVFFCIMIMLLMFLLFLSAHWLKTFEKEEVQKLL